MNVRRKERKNVRRMCCSKKEEVRNDERIECEKKEEQKKIIELKK